MESDIAHGTDLLPHLYHERGDKEQQQAVVEDIPEEVLDKQCQLVIIEFKREGAS